jgi:hypothetical protein
MLSQAHRGGLCMEPCRPFEEKHVCHIPTAKETKLKHKKQCFSQPILWHFKNGNIHIKKENPKPTTSFNANQTRKV